MFRKNLLSLFLIFGILEVFPSLALPNEGVTRPLLIKEESSTGKAAGQKAQSAGEADSNKAQRAAKSGEKENKDKLTGGSGRGSTRFWPSVEY
ncbi:hypothetical protein PGT21_029755 [Puccinia graminis f. sp. tritici]|uniref:Uncharacterized protein n=1 Tax=Puccinia graminis f. sp. tritici TaxID=56615 RepID=A0A5B0M7I5_PUCGR|nr:hypothetical protein PGT21_029755 [Puccinia graminis f. sp. tritici]KAA1135290.1 hypothetical protein PGTUg99_026164 [Puccinia graminis f. sp. tritici]